MDSRKDMGHTPGELQELFDELPGAGFCLDVAHAWSVDPTMKLADGLLEAFGSRLRECHVSSLVALKHQALTPGHQGLFRPVLERCRHVRLEAI